jgi:D-arginine dehydrogenase
MAKGAGMLEFLIIGGGVAGLSAGAALAPLGPTLVVEGEALMGYHASGRSAALYEAEYGAPATVALARASEKALRSHGVLSPRGLMLLGRAQDGAQFARDRAEMNMDALTLEEARARVPILGQAVAMAAISEKAQNLDTDALMQGYLRTLKAQGGALRVSARVSAITRTAQGWQVQAGGEMLEARRIVNAAGAWADGVAMLAGLPGVGIRPHRRSIAQIPAPGGHDVSGWPMLIGAGETWYAKPEAGKLLVSPAEEDPAEPHDAWADDMVLAEGLARYEEMVSLPVTRVETSWAGLRSFAPDRTLVLGPDPLDTGFLWCAGQGGQGFLCSPGAAAVLAERAGGPLSGQPAAILAAVDPARFRKSGTT